MIKLLQNLKILKSALELLKAIHEKHIHIAQELGFEEEHVVYQEIQEHL